MWHPQAWLHTHLLVCADGVAPAVQCWLAHQYFRSQKVGCGVDILAASTRELHQSTPSTRASRLSPRALLQQTCIAHLQSHFCLNLHAMRMGSPHRRTTQRCMPAQIEAMSTCSLEERHGMKHGPGCSSLERFEDLVRRLYGQVSVKNLVQAMSTLRKMADEASRKRGERKSGTRAPICLLRSGCWALRCCNEPNDMAPEPGSLYGGHRAGKTPSAHYRLAETTREPHSSSLLTVPVHVERRTRWQRARTRSCRPSMWLACQRTAGTSSSSSSGWASQL